MKDKYSVSLIISSADESSVSNVGSFNKDDKTEEDIRRHANGILSSVKLEYNQHARIEVWLIRANGIQQMIYDNER